MDEQSGEGSKWASATVVAAVIGCVSAVLSAVLPWWLGSYSRAEHTVANPNLPAVAAPITPLAAASTRTLPNLTLGVWTVVESTDEEGSDFRGSTIKFKTQRETPEGLELVGWFEWRNNISSEILGQEHFLAQYDATSRQLFIEGQYVESPTGRLAIGSFSARLSDDGRQLVEGTWGNTPNHQAGVPGNWQARR